MSNFDLDPLFDNTANPSLDGLEARIWQGVATRERDHQTSRKTATYQLGILVLAVTISAIVGVKAVGELRDALDLSSGAQHTPSHLLLGLPR